MTRTSAHGDTDEGRAHRDTAHADPEARPLDVDWDLAGRWGGRFASPGPTADRADLERMVVQLRSAADRALPLAVTASRLGSALDVSGRAGQRADVLVVDRPGWARAVGQSFDAMTAGMRGDDDRAGVLSAVRAAPATAQAAALLGVLAGRVLGQFDPFAAGAPVGGRLLLVAPNLLRMERLLKVDPEDFRLWVCLHEQTHALQFAAAPWLADHLRQEVTELVRELARTTPAHEVVSAAEAARRALRRGKDDGLGLLELALDDTQRARVDRITAVMSLLEGHADVAMDAVGASVIPSVRTLRSRLEARRRQTTGLDRVLGRLLGMEAKMAQYRRGAAFVRQVRRAGGRDALDVVWSSPAMLPTPGEIAEPRLWVSRVRG